MMPTGKTPVRPWENENEAPGKREGMNGEATIGKAKKTDCVFGLFFQATPRDEISPEPPS